MNSLRKYLAGLAVLIPSTASANSQTPEPSYLSASTPPAIQLVAETQNVKIVIGGEEVGTWTLIPADYPKQLNLPVSTTEATEFCFVNLERRACASFMPGTERRLEIRFAGVMRPTVVRAVFDRPPAHFTRDYQDAHRGKVLVEVPAAYELVNIAIALSDFGIADKDLIYQNSDYYREVRRHFDPFRDHPLVRKINAQLSENRNVYFPLKMNAYSLTLDPLGKVVRSDIYDRTGFEGSYQNEILPLIDDLNDFAARSNFRQFFSDHQATYRQQEAFFETEANVGQINVWLRREFPSVPAYDGVKIVFSPLVGFNQSLAIVEADSYRELQPHINFPYGRNPSLSAGADAIERSAILFTEMNHGFINPTSATYVDDINRIFQDRAIWADDTKATQYYGSPKLLFDEYMNWALTSLYYLDRMSPQDFEIANESLIANMENRRGFKKFAEFDAALLRLYKARPAGTPVEALYRDILAWCLALEVDQGSTPRSAPSVDRR